MDADGVISAGDLDFREFSSKLVRKVVFLQLEFSAKGAEDRYGRHKIDDFGSIARHFLTELKDGTLTETSLREMNARLSAIFPKFTIPDETTFRAKFGTRLLKR